MDVLAIVVVILSVGGLELLLIILRSSAPQLLAVNFPRLDRTSRQFLYMALKISIVSIAASVAVGVIGGAVWMAASSLYYAISAPLSTSFVHTVFYFIAFAVFTALALHASGYIFSGLLVKHFGPNWSSYIDYVYYTSAILLSVSLLAKIQKQDSISDYMGRWEIIVGSFLLNMKIFKNSAQLFSAFSASAPLIRGLGIKDRLIPKRLSDYLERDPEDFIVFYGLDRGLWSKYRIRPNTLLPLRGSNRPQNLKLGEDFRAPE
jgi:hypothetical protein